MKTAHPSLEVREGTRRLLRAVPMTQGTGIPRRVPAPRGSVLLSRFVCLRRQGNHWLAESPLSLFRLELSDPAAMRLIGSLIRPCTAARLSRETGVAPATARATLSLLQTIGLLTRAETRGTAEDADGSLQTWEFADLLLHARSRLGNHDQPIGGTFPFRGRLAALPAVKAPTRGRTIRLPAPRGDRNSDRATLRAVLEKRRSVRDFGGSPLSLAELGEFLRRTAGIRRMVPVGRGQPYQATRRPAPSGGGCHPLEVYLVAGRCRGLERLVHHYDPLGHRLTALAGSGTAARKLLADARQAVGASRGPQALLIFGARFGRVSWKYQSIAYATILKDTGALMQTMYLVAGGMGLAGCAAGCGNARLLAKVIGTRFYEESSVGEFLLGRAAAGGAD